MCMLSILIVLLQILGETNFQPREFPRSGSKAENVKEEEDQKSMITMVSTIRITDRRTNGMPLYTDILFSV